MHTHKEYYQEKIRPKKTENIKDDNRNRRKTELLNP